MQDIIDKAKMGNFVLKTKLLYFFYFFEDLNSIHNQHYEGPGHNSYYSS